MTSHRVTDILYESEAALRLVTRELATLTAPATDSDAAAERFRALTVVDVPSAIERPLDLPAALHVASEEVLVGLEVLRYSLRLLGRSRDSGAADGTAVPAALAQNLAYVESLSRDLETRLVTVQQLLDQLRSGQPQPG